MADVIDGRPGGGGGKNVNTKYVDASGDGSYPEQIAGTLWGWNTASLGWVKVVADNSGSIQTTGNVGGGGPVTIADGADVAQGTTTDLSSANTVVGLLKAIKAAVQGTLGISGTVTANQGTAGSTAWKVDGSGVTQPVSGTVTANVGTTNGLALDATLTGGSAKTIIRGGAKGTTAAADLTSNPVDANTQALHVDGSKVTQPVSGTFWQATQPVSGTVTANIGTTNGLALDSSLTTLDTDLKATQPRDVTDRSGRLLGHVTVDSSALPTGAAADSSLSTLHTDVTTLDTDMKAALGAASSTPAAYTVIDQLTALRKLAQQELAAVQALAPAKPVTKTQPTLLHRSY